MKLITSNHRPMTRNMKHLLKRERRRRDEYWKRKIERDVENLVHFTITAHQVARKFISKFLR